MGVSSEYNIRHICANLVMLVKQKEEMLRKLLLLIQTRDVGQERLSVSALPRPTVSSLPPPSTLLLFSSFPLLHEPGVDYILNSTFQFPELGTVHILRKSSLP